MEMASTNMVTRVQVYKETFLKSKDAQNKTLFTSLTIFCLVSILLPVLCSSGNRAVRSFQRDIANDDTVSAENLLLKRLRRRRSIDVTETESERDDAKCKSQREQFKTLRDDLEKGNRLEETHVFQNESKFNLAMAWAGANDDGTLLVLTTEAHFLASAESTLWRSIDHGRTWENWTDHVDGHVFRKDDGLQRNPHNPSKVYLVSYEHFIYVTENGGETWAKVDLTKSEANSFAVDEQLEFHPDQAYEDYVAIVSNSRKLFVTYDNFQSTPKEMKSSIHFVKWGTKEAQSQSCLYVTTGDFSTPYFNEAQMLDLERYNRVKDEWETVLKKVYMFDVQGKFIYASIFKSDHPLHAQDDKLMMISSDGGNTWNEAQLPTLTGDRFFSVLDMSEDLIFMHVDNPGDTGHGVLYTSSSTGLIYSESLRNHLYPNYNTVHDFYKVESVRGVYLSSQMKDDQSIHTVITYNRGGEWKNVSRPVGVGCKNEEREGCYLQIHNAYSIHRGIKAQLPHSQKEAYGLFLVHAHVASNLQTTAPDVFVSRDGGYTFDRVLKGPHAYEIADSGGLIVAVPLETDYPDTIKFSTDEGRCWHVYKFTNEEIRFTGLLTEPGGKSMTIALWGYTKDTKKWTVNVIDFNKVVTRQCKEEDYQEWTPHTAFKAEGQEGCLLGKKEHFKRIKPDSWCRNGYAHDMEIVEETCLCTREDYECDFGFYRPDGSTKCVRQPEIPAKKLDICVNGHVEQLETIGYRLVPGDVCDNKKGFNPASDFTKLSSVCEEGDKKAITHDITPVAKNTGSKKLVIGAIIIVVLVLIAVIGAFFTYKLVLLRRHKVVYRYSMLNQTDERDNEFENALVSHDTLYRESSDEEVEQENKSPQRNGVWPAKDKPTVASYHDDSDDDMLG